VQKKINQIDNNDDIQNWNEFITEVKITFSNKSKIADIKWKIKSFRQEKKHIADFIIKFEVLVMKAETNDIHAIFLLKKNIRTNIIKIILRYLPIAVLETLKE